MKQLWRKQLNNLLSSKGFTMAEFLLATAILLVLGVIAAIGAVGYSHDLKLMEMDGTAKQLFVAAQNHLTGIETSGILYEYEKQGVGLGYPMTDEKDMPHDFENADYNSSMEAWRDEVIGKDSHAFYRIGHNGAVSTEHNLKESILNDMLPFGAIDDTVRRSGSYYIEYDLKTGQVYSVFYTDSAEGFTEKEIGLLNTGGRQSDEIGRYIRKNLLKTSAGKRKIVGYYGGGSTANLKPLLLKEPEILVENGEKLVIKIKDFNFFVKDELGNAVNSALKVTVTGVDSGKSKTLDLSIDSLSSSSSYRPSAKADMPWLWNAVRVQKSAIGTQVLEEHILYTLTLDDISKSGVVNPTHFTDIFPQLIPGENIRIEAELSSSTVVSGTVSSQIMTNSIFGAAEHIIKKIGVVSQDTGKLSVGVSAVRHLENLNTDVSNLTVPVEKVYLTDDIHWKGVADGYTEITGSQDIYSHNNVKELNEKLLSRGSFYPLQNRHIRLFVGNGKTIYSLPIIASEIFKSERYGELVSGIGIFGEIKNSAIEIRDVTLSGISVNGAKSGGEMEYAGVLCGYLGGKAQVKISNVLVNRPVASTKPMTNEASKSKDSLNVAVRGAASESSVLGAKNCGGLIGGASFALASGTGDIYGLWASDCTVSGVNIKALQNAGGLIGSLNGGKNEILHSYSAGTTINGKYPLIDGGSSIFKIADVAKYDIYSVRNAGGFIGKISSRGSLAIRSCFAACSVAGGDFTGGFIGNDENASSKYEYCYTAAPASNLGTGNNGQRVGAFAGKLSTKDVISCEYNKNYYYEDGKLPIALIAEADKKLPHIPAVKVDNSGGAVPLREKVAAKTTSEMILDTAHSIGAEHTHRYDRSIATNSGFPYRAVNATGYIAASGSPTIRGVYYGDWEEPKDVITTEALFVENLDLEKGHLFAYREKVNDRWNWYFMNILENGERTSYLINENDVAVKEWQYGFVIPKGDKLSKYLRGTREYRLSDEVVIQTNDANNMLVENTYEFYEYHGDDIRVQSPELVMLPEEYVIFDNRFAASMTIAPDFRTGIRNLGTKRNPYQVRCEKQLANVSLFGIFSYYNQTCGFEVVNQRLPITLTVIISYDATYDSAKDLRYNIVYKADPDAKTLFWSLGSSIKACINGTNVS